MAGERLSDSTAAAGGFRLQAAGVPRLVGPDGPLRPGTRKALALAVLLALDGPMRRDHLASVLWPEAEAADARRNLRRDVFRLRQAGLAVAETGGDALALADVSLDWPDPGPAAPRWLDGLEDAGGEALADWLEPQRARLHAAWLQGLEAQAARLEADGREAQALAAWQALLSEGCAGPAHAPARQAVQRLQQQLASGAASGPAATLPERTPFVGRRVPLDLIAQALDRGQLVFIDGAPGVGKTRLALEAAAARGGALWARCRPDDEQLPYASATRLLQQLLEAAPDVELPGWVKRELQPLVPAWATTADDEPPPRVNLAARRRAFGSAWRLLARGNFGALVIDDWQWADASSQELWDLDRADDDDGPEALVRLVVHRSESLGPGAAEQRRQLLESGRAEAVTLTGLEADEFEQLMDRLMPAGSRELRGRLLRTTGGHPMFLLELLRHRAAGALDEGAPLPMGVRETVLARVRALGPSVRQVLEAASLVGDDFGPRELAGATGLDELAVATALERAAGAQLLAEGPAGRSRFAHDLVAQVLAENLAPARRAVLHARLAASEAEAGAPPARVAAHLLRAGREAEAAPWCERAGQAAMRVGRWPEAERQFAAAAAGTTDAALAARALLGHALARWRQSDPAGADQLIAQALAQAPAGGGAERADALLLRADLWAVTGRAAEALLLVQALQADPALRPEQQLQAREQEGECLSVLGRHAEAVPLLRRLVDSLPPTALPMRIRLLRTLTRAANLAGDYVGAQAMEHECLDFALASGDLYAAATHASNLSAALRELGRPDEARAMAERALELCDRSGNLQVLRATLYGLVVLHTDAGRSAQALELIERAERAAPFWHSPHLQQAFLEARLYVHVLRGEVDAARAAAPRVLAAARASNHMHFHLGGLNIVFDFHVALGEVQAARALVEEMRAALGGGSGDSIRSDDLQLRDWQCRLLEGQAAAVAAELPQGDEAYGRRRVDEQARQCAVATLALARSGQPEAAGPWIDRGLALQGNSLELRGQFLVAALQACPPGDVERRRRVESAGRALLADPHVPALEGRALRQALP